VRQVIAHGLRIDLKNTTVIDSCALDRSCKPQELSRERVESSRFSCGVDTNETANDPQPWAGGVSSESLAIDATRIVAFDSRTLTKKDGRTIVCCGSCGACEFLDGSFVFFALFVAFRCITDGRNFIFAVWENRESMIDTRREMREGDRRGEREEEKTKRKKWKRQKLCRMRSYILTNTIIRHVVSTTLDVHISV